MGEDYEAMMNFKLFCDGELVQADAKPIDLTEAMNKVVVEEEWPQHKPFTAEWNAVVINNELLEKLRKLLPEPSRKFTRGEKMLFIRTVERHGRVEFTLSDWSGIVNGVYIPYITVVCKSPRQVRLLLRMKNIGKVTYKIRKGNVSRRT